MPRLPVALPACPLPSLPLSPIVPACARSTSQCSPAHYRERGREMQTRLPGCTQDVQRQQPYGTGAPQQHRPEGFGGSLVRRNAAGEFGHGVQGSIVHSKQPASRRRTRELIQMHRHVALTLPLRASTRGVKSPVCAPPGHRVQYYIACRASSRHTGAEYTIRSRSAQSLGA